MKPAKSTNVLVVDDNPINLKLADVLGPRKEQETEAAPEPKATK
jgi:CheY-like chemotaxis protein